MKNTIVQEIELTEELWQPGPPGVAPHEQIAQEVYQDAMERKRFKEEGIPLGPVTGFPKLDERLGGYLVPGVYVINGEPGVGKSTFALQAADQSGVPTLYITLEMTPHEMQLKRACRTFEKDGMDDYYNGKLEPEELQQRCLALSAELCFVDGTSRSLSIKEIMELSESIGARLIVLDSLHAWIRRSAEKGTEYERIGNAMNQLTALSKRLKVPVICVAERSRHSGSEGGLASSAGSRAIEYGAQTLICMNETVNEGDGIGYLDLKIEKNRARFKGGISKLKFNGVYQRFAEQG